MSGPSPQLGLGVGVNIVYTSLEMTSQRGCKTVFLERDLVGEAGGEGVGGGL